MTVFPNPAFNAITISCSEPILLISLADISGKKSLQQKGDNNNSTTLDLTNLKTGIYVLSIATKSGVRTERIVKKDN